MELPDWCVFTPTDIDITYFSIFLLFVYTFDSVLSFFYI